jgi:hypothetical protein
VSLQAVTPMPLMCAVSQMLAVSVLISATQRSYRELPIGIRAGLRAIVQSCKAPIKLHFYIDWNYRLRATLRIFTVLGMLQGAD